MWRAEDPQGDEAGKIKWHIVPYTSGDVLDVGCGPRKTFAHFTGVDNMHHANEFGWRYGPDIIRIDDCADLKRFGTESWDAVFSSHTLEHVEDFEGCLKEWWRVIKVGGHLVLYLPHRSFYPNIGQPGSNPDHKHDFIPKDIIDAMMKVAPGWDLIENEERNGGREYSFFQVYRKRDDRRCVVHSHPWKKPGSKMVCIVRYGGYGDMIQTSSILPGLKAEGWHVTVMTTPKGRDVLEGNPYVDRYLLQDGSPHPDQVPNAELGPYWDVWRAKFDRWINLSESIEGELLALPGRMRHFWPHHLRHEKMNDNYLEFTHKLAGVPLPPKPAFYPSEADMQWWWEQLLGLDGFLVMWVLAGSSLHKAYPHTDNAVAMLMNKLPDVKVIFVGDERCQILEGGWEKEPRVICTSGKWSIRQTLTAAMGMHVVIGPETGVLNAVAMRPNAKVVMLSHSSAENLTKGWVNTDTIVPDVPCHPCHQLHYGREFCPEWKTPIEGHRLQLPENAQELKMMMDGGHIVDGMFHTGASICAASIPHEGLYETILRHYESWQSQQVIPATG